MLTPKDSSIEESLQNLKKTSNIDIEYLEAETGIKNKYLITDRKNSLVIELNDNKDNGIDKYSHCLEKKEDKNLTTFTISIHQQYLAQQSLPIASLLCYLIFQYLKLYGEQTELFEKLKQEDLLKTEFINIAAHELRTPIQSIIGYFEMIKSFPERTTTYLQPIKRNAQRLYD